jgi:hypothetical protein
MRFVLIGAHHTNEGPSRKLRSGTKIADSAANALPGDVVCASLCAKPNNTMQPLDAAAVSALAAVGITAPLGGPTRMATGAESIDA